MLRQYSPVAEAPVVDATFPEETVVDAAEPEPLPVAVGAAVVDRKFELMQEAWQSAYLSVSAAVPFPCGH